MKQDWVAYETLEDMVKPAHTALLVIDVQNDLCQRDCQAMVAQLRCLISTARKAGVMVTYIQNSVHPAGLSYSPSEIVRRRKFSMQIEYTVDGTWGQQIVDQIAPEPNDPVVRKHRMSCFLGTDLDVLLHCRGVESVVCTGVSTHGCVMNTAYSAIGNDYYVVVVEDCVASRQHDLHNAALHLMKNAMHHVVDSDRLMSIWERQSR